MSLLPLNEGQEAHFRRSALTGTSRGCIPRRPATRASTTATARRAPDRRRPATSSAYAGGCREVTRVTTTAGYSRYLGRSTGRFRLRVAGLTRSSIGWARERASWTSAGTRDLRAAYARRRSQVAWCDPIRFRGSDRVALYERAVHEGPPWDVLARGDGCEKRHRQRAHRGERERDSGQLRAKESCDQFLVVEADHCDVRRDAEPAFLDGVIPAHRHAVSRIEQPGGRVGKIEKTHGRLVAVIGCCAGMHHEVRVEVEAALGDCAGVAREPPTCGQRFLGEVHHAHAAVAGIQQASRRELSATFLVRDDRRNLAGSVGGVDQYGRQPVK